MSEETFRWVVAGGVAIATLCILVQAAVMLVLFRVVKAVQAKAEPLIEKAEELTAQAKPILTKVSALVTQAGPVLETGKTMLADLQPKVSKVSTDVTEMVAIVRQQVHEISDFMSDFMIRAKAKVERVDEAIDDTVGQVHQAGESAKRAVLWPIKGAEGVVAGLKAGFAAFASGRRPTVDHVTQDEEMFI